MRATRLLVVFVLLGLLVTGCGSHENLSRGPEAHYVSTWAPPGSRPLPDAQAAKLVTHRPELRPENAVANAYVPTDTQLRKFYSARNRYGETAVKRNPLLRFVTGRPGLVHPSTDDLVQWVAHKWGIPTDLVRAQVMLESLSRMNRPGDRRRVPAAWYSLYPEQARIAGTHDVYESMGIAQVKWTPNGDMGAGTEPLRWESTAFNLDVYAATIRYYYDGYCHWCSSGYTAGQGWNSMGAWFSPAPWNNPGARLYLRHVQRFLEQRGWE